MIDSHAHIGKFCDWDFKIEELYEQIKNADISQAIISNLAGNQFDYNHQILNKYSTYEINQMTLEKIKKYSTFKMLIWIRPLMDKDLA